MHFFERYPELSEIRAIYEQQAAPSLRAELRTQPCPPTHSKIGGPAFWPTTQDWPQHEGQDLHFLAQINFSETSPLEGFPKEGLLQFFINGADKNWGAQPDTRTEGGFRVIFHEASSLSNASFREAHFSMTQASVKPLHHSHQLIWKKEKSYLSGENPTALRSGFDQQLHEIGYLVSEHFEGDEYAAAELLEELSAATFPDGVRIGGHAGFHHYPMDFAPQHKQHNCLLLQLEQVEEDWPEEYPLHFFIRPEDLAQRRFEEVAMYHG